MVGFSNKQYSYISFKFKTRPVYLWRFARLTFALVLLVGLSNCTNEESKVPNTNNTVLPSNEEAVSSTPKDSIHAETGLVVAEGFAQVRALCTPCHSAKLITQNSASRDGWEQMIRWMQATQGLGSLGDHEGVILDYLAVHYAPQEVGRRANLAVEDIEFYILDLEE